MSVSPAPPRTFIDVQGLRTSVLHAGEGGPNLLMLHGWGVDTSLVWPLAERMVTVGYSVLAPDLPGFGESEAPPKPWTVFDYTKFLLALMDAQGIGRTHLFGHSFGGRLGLILGAEHSDRLHRLVLANSAGIRPRQPLSTQVRLRAYRSLRDGLNALGMRSLADTLRTWYNERYGSADFNAASGVMRQTFVKVVNEDLLPYARRVKPSTLLLWGDQDTDTPLWQGKALEAAIPDAGLVVYPGAGHYSYLDALPDAVRVIDYFFKQE